MSLNVWFHESSGDAEQEVAHPESFLTDVGKFLEQHCRSLSLFQVYEGTCLHNDDQEFVLFIAGRLEVASDTLMDNFQGQRAHQATKKPIPVPTL